MKQLLYITIVLFSCGKGGGFCDHACEVKKAFPKLKPPIIVIAKDCHEVFGCNVILRDSENTLLPMGNMSFEGPVIGASYNVGDTLR